jgi:methylthioribulose-1-phosphate dehydratase
MDHADIARALCATCRLFGERRWCLATSGNFSARVEPDRFLITKSGREKSDLDPGDLMLCDASGAAVDPHNTPSAETPLHACLYELDAGVGAVLHTHSVAATRLSMAADAELVIAGYEMQKAFDGIGSHDDTVTVAVFDNDQDMVALAERLADKWRAGAITAPGFLIRGHGLYAWGADVAAARRHVEGFEFLFECLLAEAAAR